MPAMSGLSALKPSGMRPAHPLKRRSLSTGDYSKPRTTSLTTRSGKSLAWELIRARCGRRSDEAPSDGSPRSRALARAKLRRRLLWLQHSLEEVESAVEAVLDAPGVT